MRTKNPPLLMDPEKDKDFFKLVIPPEIAKRNRNWDDKVWEKQGILARMIGNNEIGLE